MTTSTLVLAAPRVVAGMLMALAGALGYTAMDTVVKLLTAHLPSVQILFVVYGVGLLPPLAWCLATGNAAALRSRRPLVQLVRGLAMLLASLLFFHALSRLPLADAYALLFTMPLIITALSVPMLGEPVGWRRLAAVIAGFLGVLVMLRPGSGIVEPAALGVLACAAAAGFGNVLIRRFGAVETAESFVVWGNLTVVVGTLPFAAAAWVTPTAAELPLLLVAGLLGGLAALAVTTAYRVTPAALVAPFQYMQMPGGLLTGYLLFGDLPEPLMLAGAGIIIGSGLYILHREARLGLRG
ncbi:MAG TPA: DMT family transporter [Geminicoccaceae bacterium]|nr:DMT family transporter [Geminicoccus sp.]HMU51956.1 DMT family transporter [Geminicoccaceae bacterium]